MKRSLWVALALVAFPSQRAGAQKARDVADLSLEELAKVRVVAVSKEEESVTGAPASVTVVSRRDMERMGWRTVADALDAAPGMLMTSSLLVRYAPAIRGDLRATGGLHVLYLLDGRPLRGSMDALNSQDLFARIPIAMLDRIEVIRGPGSVLYGTNAIAGVINLVTQGADSSGARVEGTVGSLNSRSALGRATVARESSRFSITAQAQDDPDVAAAVNDKNGNSREARLPAHSNVVFGSAAAGGLSLDALYSDWNSPSLNSHAGGIPNLSFFAHELAVNGSWQGDFSSAVRGVLNVGYTGTSADWDSSLGIYPVSDDFIVEGTLFAHIDPKLHLLAGGVLNVLTGNAVYLGTPSLTYNERSTSAYVQADYRPASGLRLSVGAQAVDAVNRPTEVVPRVAFVYDGAGGVGAKLLYGEAFRAPSPAETEMNSATLAGNRDLLPERVRTSEAIVSWHGERGELVLSLFDSRQMDLISPIVRDGAPSTYVNRGVFDSRGGELEGRYVFSRAWSLFGSVSYQSNTIDDTLHNVGRAPLAMAKLGAVWMPVRSVSVSMFDNWLGEPPPIQRLFPTVPNVNPAGGDYHIVSAHVAVQLGGLLGMPPAVGLAATLHVDNLLDQSTWYPDATLGGVNSLPWRPGRVVSVGVRVER